jgi:hypothetical protein
MLGLASLHDLHLELLGFLPPALVRICRRKVRHTRQRVGMVHVGYPAVMVLSLVPRPACVDQVAMSLYVYY